MVAGCRRHHFWDCVVAVSLREVISEALGPGVPLSRLQLWLVRPPVDVAAPVWDVVCLAAIAALESGRQTLYAGRDTVPRARLRRKVCAVVVSDFWSRLAAFVAAGLTPRGWDRVPACHPFLARSHAGGLVFCGPPDDTASPPASP